jgi:hypothetical protein
MYITEKNFYRVSVIERKFGNHVPERTKKEKNKMGVACSAYGRYII